MIFQKRYSNHLQKAYPDKDMIEGCMLNQRKAQEQLYYRFYEPMMNICLRYSKNEQDAVDILQNGFLKVFKNIASYKPELASLYTWIRAIMVNAAIDFVRKKDRLRRHLELEAVELPAAAVDVLNKLDAQELLTLIQQLPPATQMVFNLYVVDGFNHREIAAMCGISEGTSKWHLSEARKLLRQLIHPQQSAV